MPAFLIMDTHVIRIKKEVTTIGRSLENDVVIQLPSVSRRHAQIQKEDDKYYLIDLDSTSGTWLNSVRIKKAALKAGDSIILAGAVLVFVNNIPHLAEKAKKSTGSLKDPGPDSSPTVKPSQPIWRPED